MLPCWPSRASAAGPSFWPAGSRKADSFRRNLVTRIAAGRVERGLPRALHRCGYKTISLYPAYGAFLSARKFQETTGVGRFKTRTSDGGRYELVIDGALSDKVIFDHPRLRLFRIPERVQNVSVAPGSRGQALVIVPSYATLRNRLCGPNETGTDAQGMAVGYVRDSTGNAVRNAHVWVTWQVQWIEQSGRLVSTNQQRTVETDTGPDGSYMLCGFTKGAQITAKVGMAGKSTVQEKLVIPPSMVLEHDFQIGAR